MDQALAMCCTALANQLLPLEMDDAETGLLSAICLICGGAGAPPGVYMGSLSHQTLSRPYPHSDQVAGRLFPWELFLQTSQLMYSLSG